MIAVTSANGRTGRAVVRALLLSGHDVRAFDVDQSVEGLGHWGAETVIGDLLDPHDVQVAVAGCWSVVHIGPPLHPREADMGHNVVAAARRSGVEHFVQLSVAHPQLEPLLNHQAKLAVERLVLTSRMPFTILQPMHYMQNIDPLEVIDQGVLASPYSLETPLSLVDREEVAEVAALVVEQPAHYFATYELCGSDVLNARQLAATMAEVSGRPVEVRQVPLATSACNAPNGRPTEEEDYQRDAMQRLFDHYGRYGITGNPNVLRWLLGRPPGSFEGYVRRSLRERPPATSGPFISRRPRPLLDGRRSPGR